MAQLLKDKVAIVTGAGRGIGKAIALKFASEGAKIVLADLDIEQVENVKREIEENNGTAMSCEVDVSNVEQVRSLFEEIDTTFESVDIVVNNAGVTRDAMLHKMTDEQFQQVVDVHMKGAFLFMREAANRMKQQNSGAIVNVSSIAGKVGNIGQINYSGAKAGIIGMTKAAAKELARFNVRVNAIQPGFINTDMTKTIPQKAWDAMLTQVPLGRVGEPEEIANTALFLSSDLSSYITGIVVEVTGGFAM